MTRGILLSLVGALCLTPAAAVAQEMSAAERTAALARVRQMADCMEQQRSALSRVMRLIAESETQRDTARDPRVRRDAEAAIEALIARASDVQRASRRCFEGDLPAPGTQVIVEDPPADPAADAIAGTHGTVRSVERDARLTDHVRIVSGEQVDGQGRLDASVVQSAVRTIGSQLDRCYATYLDRGSIDARQLNLVFTVRGSGRPQRVAVERSGFADAAFERCVRTAGQRIRFSRGPSGGEAIYSYSLRFGR